MVSYVYVEKVGIETDPLFYWKLFVDFDAIWEKQNGPLVFHYGKKKDEESETPVVQKKRKRKTKRAFKGERWARYVLSLS